MSDEKKEWLKLEIDELINIYHNKPELWDVKCKEYKNRIMKRDALTEMAGKFATTTEEISRKIHNLRNQFNSELKKAKKKHSGDGVDDLYISKWPYFKSLSFLQGGSLCRSAAGNIPTEDVSENIGNDEGYNDTQNVAQQGDGMNTVNKLDENMSVNIEKGPRKKQKTEVEKPNDVLMKKALRTLSEVEDQYDIFGKYIASELRTLNSDYLRKKMKRKIQQIIIDVNEEEEQLSNAHSSIIYSNPCSIISVSGQSDQSNTSQQYTTNHQSSQSLASYIQNESNYLNLTDM